MRVCRAFRTVSKKNKKFQEVVETNHPKHDRERNKTSSWGVKISQLLTAHIFSSAIKTISDIGDELLDSKLKMVGKNLPQMIVQWQFTMVEKPT